MAKSKIDEIYEKAKQIGIKRENLDIGLKENEEQMVNAINQAYSFLKGIKKR